MPAYQELKNQADQQWTELTSGETPWVRVGSALCGHAAGAFQVIEAFRSELERREIEAVIDERCGDARRLSRARRRRQHNRAAPFDSGE